MLCNGNTAQEVKHYKGERFDNANSTCIQCGVCIDVCPMDVLSFDVADQGPMGR